MGRLFGFCRTAWKRVCCLLVYDIINFRLEKNRTESGNHVPRGGVGRYVSSAAVVCHKQTGHPEWGVSPAGNMLQCTGRLGLACSLPLHIYS